jgi:hypothetical protein
MKDKELGSETHPLVTPDHLRRKAAVYIRQSSEEQVRENTGSTAFQRSLVTTALEIWMAPVANRNYRRGSGAVRIVKRRPYGVATITNNDVRRRNRYCDRR